MNKQILLILVLTVAWTFSGPAAPGPIDPAGAGRNVENGAAPAPEADTGPAPVDKARLQGQIKQLQATLQNAQDGLRRIDPAGAPPATETDAPPSPDAGAGTEAATDSNAGPETAANQGAEAATPVDPTQLRGQIEQFQAVIEDALRQDVRSAVLSAPKGAYLEDYGAVFSTEASLYRIRLITPFSRRPYSQEELDQAHRAALERLERLKQGLRQAVAEHGSLLGQLKPEHNVAVIVHLFNGVGDPSRPYPSQLIFKARAGSVSDYRQGKITMEELVRQVRISQF